MKKGIANYVENRLTTTIRTQEHFFVDYFRQDYFNCKKGSIVGLAVRLHPKKKEKIKKIKKIKKKERINKIKKNKSCNTCLDATLTKSYFEF